jgi:hypothetical protein
VTNPLHGSFVAERLKAARTAAGGTIAWSRVAEIIQHAYEEEAKAFTAMSGAPKEPRKQPVARKRNEFVDALASACGGNPQFLTPGAIRTVAIAWAEIKSVSPDCTVEELHRRASRYKSLHPTWPCTATSLSKYWDQLGQSLGRTDSAKLDAYVQPPDWLAKATRLYPEADFSDREWKDLPITIRTSILQKS